MITGEHHLHYDEVALVNDVMRALVDQYRAVISRAHVWRATAGARVEITFEALNYHNFGGIDLLLDALMDTIYACQQRERQIRNLTVGSSHVSFYLYF